jgi:hypothetical protein
VSRWEGGGGAGFEKKERKERTSEVTVRTEIMTIRSSTSKEQVPVFLKKKKKKKEVCWLGAQFPGRCLSASGGHPAACLCK